MEFIIKGTPEEIAALVVAVQERQGPMFDEASVLAAINRYRESQDPDRPAFSL